jgi:CheY-like chemotaxis protein
MLRSRATKNLGFLIPKHKFFAPPQVAESLRMPYWMAAEDYWIGVGVVLGRPNFSALNPSESLEETMKYGHLLIADKHMNMLEGIRSLLADLFETIFMVADRDSLLEAVRRIRLDLAIVDLSLPAAGDIDVVCGLKKRFPDLKIIVLSVHDEQFVANEALSAGAEAFVLKRCAADDLIPAVHEVLEGRTFVSDSVKP